LFILKTKDLIVTNVVILENFSLLTAHKKGIILTTRIIQKTLIKPSTSGARHDQDLSEVADLVVPAEAVRLPGEPSVSS